MVRLLTETDREQTLKFLNKQPGLNLFQIGDIENFGFDSDVQTIWGSFDELGHLMVCYFDIEKILFLILKI